MTPEQHLFIIGAPRSGTTFLQNLLGAHPLIATSQETDLFDYFVQPLRSAWQTQLRDDPEEWQRWRHKGLPAVLGEDAFDDAVGAFIERVHSATLALKPGARLLLEKTPGYGRHGELILRYLPHAKFIHIVRDGRDVVCSMVRASRGWGRAWAPADVEHAAAQWDEHVRAARGISALTDAYFELRYEELSPERVQAALAFCGVEASVAECESVFASCSLEGGAASSLVWGGEVTRRLGGIPSEPPGFAGEGGIGAWQGELDLANRLLFERTAGALLRELGYADDGWIGETKAARALAGTRLAIRRRLAQAQLRAVRLAHQAGL